MASVVYFKTLLGKLDAGEKLQDFLQNYDQTKSARKGTSEYLSFQYHNEEFTTHTQKAEPDYMHAIQLLTLGMQELLICTQNVEICHNGANLFKTDFLRKYYYFKIKGNYILIYTLCFGLANVIQAPKKKHRAAKICLQ